MNQMEINNRTNTKVVTGMARLSYAHVWEPKAIDGISEPKYSVSILIPKSDTKTVAAIKKAIDIAIESGIQSKFGGKRPPSLKTPLRDGDAERADDPVYTGHFFLNATSKTKPGIIDINKREITNTNEVYSGCYGRVSVNFYAFNTNGNKGIACGLNNIMKLKDGAQLGGRSRAEDDFDDDFDLSEIVDDLYEDLY